MKILKHGKYNGKAVVTCHHCECEFETEYGECSRNDGSPQVWINCPECGEIIILPEEDFQTELSEKEKISRTMNTVGIKIDITCDLCNSVFHVSMQECCRSKFGHLCASCPTCGNHIRLTEKDFQHELSTKEK